MLEFEIIRFLTLALFVCCVGARCCENEAFFFRNMAISGRFLAVDIMTRSFQVCKQGKLYFFRSSVFPDMLHHFQNNMFFV